MQFATTLLACITHFGLELGVKYRYKFAVDDLRHKIDDLDRLLVVGTNQYRQMFNDYNDLNKLDNFNLDEYSKPTLESWEKWSSECVKVLDSLPRKHYLFHFVQPKTETKCFFGLPDNLSSNKILFMYQLYALEDIVLGLEESESLALRKEIADKEYQADIVYKITYLEHSREVRVNNIVLHTSNYESENDRFIAYVVAYPGRPIPKK